MKKMIGMMAFIGLVVFGIVASLQSAEAQEPTVPSITRVINACQGHVSEVNVKSLNEAANVLSVSHPDLAAELRAMANDSIN